MIEIPSFLSVPCTFKVQVLKYSHLASLLTKYSELTLFYWPLQEGRDEAKLRSRRDMNMIQKIYNALDLMRNSTCEVPFIAFYRKEEVQPELNIHDLWKVYRWDEKVWLRTVAFLAFLL